MANGVRQILLLLIPSAVIMAVLAEPITRLVYERGEFDAAATDLVADGDVLVGVLAARSRASACCFSRTFFALQRPWVTTALAGRNLVVNAVVALALYEPLGVAGIVIGTVVGTVGMALAAGACCCARDTRRPRGRADAGGGRPDARPRRRCWAPSPTASGGWPTTRSAARSAAQVVSRRARDRRGHRRLRRGRLGAARCPRPARSSGCCRAGGRAEGHRGRDRGRAPGRRRSRGRIAIAFSAHPRQARRVSPATAAFHRCAWAVPPLVLLALWERRRYGARDSSDRWKLIAAGVLFGADLVFWHYSIRDVGAGLATVARKPAGGVRAGDRLARHRRAARGAHPRCAARWPCVGVVFISGAVGAEAYGRDPALGTVWGMPYGALLLGLPAAAALGQPRPAAPGRPAARGHRRGGRDRRSRRGVHRRPRPGAAARVARVARHARPHLTGARLAAHRRSRCRACRRRSRRCCSRSSRSAPCCSASCCSTRSRALVQFLGAALILTGLLMVSLRRSRDTAAL